jgi:hypothetical protein
MKYRVVFMEPTNGEGNPSENPPEYVELDLIDGVVLDQVFVERIEPAGARPESGREDDDFLSIGTEVWEYDIAEGRDREFIDALKNSQMVIDYQQMEDVDMITPGGTT